MESDAPDLWTTAQKERAWLTSTEQDFGGNAPFTALEKEMIARHLHAIEANTIRAFKLTEEESAHVREQLGYLRDAVDRVGRFDWKNLAASTFLNIVLALGLKPQKAQQFLGWATQLLGPLVTGVRQLIS